MTQTQTQGAPKPAQPEPPQDPNPLHKQPEKGSQPAQPQPAQQPAQAPQPEKGTT